MTVRGRRSPRPTKREVRALAARVDRAAEKVVAMLMEKFSCDHRRASLIYAAAPRGQRDRWLEEAGIDAVTGKKHTRDKTL